MFCKKCGCLLRPKEVNGKKVLACCDYTTTEKPKIVEKVKEERKMEVLEEVETKPLVEMHCTKCGNGKAYYWSLQTRAADEPETMFYKCQKCKHTWREYK